MSSERSSSNKLSSTARVFLLVGCSTWAVSEAFAPSSSLPSKSVTSAHHRRSPMVVSAGSGQEEPDLFDYFDPLLSPHAYPEGISPNKTPQEQAEAAAASSPLGPGKMNVLGMDIYEKKQKEAGLDSASATATAESPAETKEAADLFDYFDPLLSPHEYPNGISPQSKPQPLEVVDDAPNSAATKNDEDASGKKKIGILLMDHGSRNAASNQRLQKLAELYKMTMDDDNVIVEAAHMEIVKPSIPDGLQALLNQGVDEIVCHPYFLSPGRHVVEDIPEILEDAIESLKIDIPIVTTDPVGSNTQLMIAAIHASVRENSKFLKQNK